MILLLYLKIQYNSFLCVYSEMDRKRREEDKEAKNKRYSQNLKLFPIMNTSYERHEQDKCFD